MSEIIDKDGQPCIEDKDNQITSDGMPSPSYKTKLVQEQMDKMTS